MYSIRLQRVTFHFNRAKRKVPGPDRPQQQSAFGTRCEKAVPQEGNYELYGIIKSYGSVLTCRHFYSICDKYLSLLSMLSMPLVQSSHVTLFSEMPWQKTFSLAKRSKGCYLITEEVTHHLSEGLRNTKVRA